MALQGHSSSSLNSCGDQRKRQTSQPSEGEKEDKGELWANQSNLSP